jgi:integrase/recombinase XerD
MIEQLLISDLVSQFLIERKSRNISPKTITLYSLELKYFCSWLEKNGYSNLSLNLLSPIILRKWFQSLSTHRNKGGIHCNYRVVKSFLNWINFEYELSEWKNPIKKVYIEPNKTLPLPEVPLDEVQKLLDVCDTGRNSLRDKCILKVLTDTAARGSELISLNVSDVDLKAGTIMIVCGKGSKPRMVYLGDKSLRNLREYLKNRNDTNPALFLNDEGERLKFFGLRMLITRLCNRAGIKVYGVHSFRRTSALTIYRKTKDIFFVSKYLGHSKIEVTIMYLNIGSEDLRSSFVVASPADSLE